jgi:putative phosphoribosyl transferase
MFRDRHEAGTQLGERLRDLRAQHPVVLGLPRGGVPVAAEVARLLGAPLDVLVVRKLGCPWQPELGVGAIGEGGVRIVDERMVADLRISRAELDEIATREAAELERRVARYRRGRPPLELAGRTVIVVDDGIATGATARAGVQVARERGAERVILAVPVAPFESVRSLRRVADEVVCLGSPAVFWAVGQFYEDFSQTSDAEVAEALAGAARSPAATGGTTVGPGTDEEPSRRERA